MALLLGLVARQIYADRVASLGARLCAIASLIADQIDAVQFQKIQSDDQPEYKAILATLRRAQATDPGIKFIYTMRRTPRKGILEFVVDAQETTDRNRNGMIDPDEEQASVGEKYNASLISPDMLTGFDGAVAEESPQTDKWGTQISGYAPIRDQHGSSIAIVGVDYDASSLDSLWRGVLKSVLIAFGLAAMLWISLAIWLSRIITRPIISLSNAIQIFGRGETAPPVRVTSRDELGVVVASFNSMVVQVKERDMYRSALNRYVSPSVAAEVLKGTHQVFQKGDRRRVTIMFTDLNSFTEMAESMAPEDVIRFLNRYFTRMIDIVFDHQGTLDKFIGDGLMVLFGAPLSDERQEEHAVRAALAMQEEVKKLREELAMPKLAVGVGINTGMVIVGNLGSDRRMEYTAIGSEVNLAARLESLTRRAPSNIVVSASTHAAIHHEFATERLDNVQLKGIAGTVTAFAVLGSKTGSFATLKFARPETPREPEA